MSEIADYLYERAVNTYVNYRERCETIARLDAMIATLTNELNKLREENAALRQSVMEHDAKAEG